MAQCAKCRAGPAGIEGHESLFTHTMDARQMQFKCQACGAFWIRRYGGGGAFEWTHAADAHTGMDIPGRHSA